MGAQVSNNYSTTKELSKIVNNAILSNKSTCTATVASNQRIVLGDIGGNLDISGINFDSSQTVNLDCLQNSENNAEILSDIKQELSKSIKSALDGQNIGLQMSTNTSYVEVVNDLTSNINIDNIKACIINAINTQEIKTGNVEGNAVIRNINFNASQDVVQKCIQNDTNTASIVNKLDTKIKEDMATTITGFISSTGFIIIAVVILLLLFAFFFLKGNKGKKQE